jgi:hypothetical protein
MVQHIPSLTLMGIQREKTLRPHSLSPLGLAIGCNDLTAVHEILVKTGYKADEETDNKREVLLTPSHSIALLISNYVNLQHSRNI